MILAIKLPIKFDGKTKYIEKYNVQGIITIFGRGLGSYISPEIIKYTAQTINQRKLWNIEKQIMFFIKYNFIGFVNNSPRNPQIIKIV